MRRATDFLAVTLAYIGVASIVMAVHYLINPQFVLKYGIIIVVSGFLLSHVASLAISLVPTVERYFERKARRKR